MGKGGIMADPEKVSNQELSPPTTVKEVRSFIGICSYYQRLIQNFSEITKPLFKLSKKCPKFEQTKECQAAFELLKELLTTAPVIAYADTSKAYILYTDASHGCICACLTQVHNEDNNSTGKPCKKPIHYISHKLTKLQTNLPPNWKKPLQFSVNFETRSALWFCNQNKFLKYIEGKKNVLICSFAYHITAQVIKVVIEVNLVA